VNLLNHALFVHVLHEKFPEAEKRAKEIRKLISKGIGAVVRSRKSQPAWETKTLIACLGNQLGKLKDLMADPEAKEVSWEHPWVETQYPVMLSRGNWGEKRTTLHGVILHFPEDLRHACATGEDIPDLTREESITAIAEAGTLSCHLTYVESDPTEPERKL
jgi:hypothetical protein